MRSNSVRPIVSDMVEITLGEQEVVASTRSMLNPNQQVPEEVRLAGPEAVEMYREFRARQAGTGTALNLKESIEIASFAPAA